MAIAAERKGGMPYDEDLDEMAQKIASCNFDQIVNPEHRAIVMGLAIQADQAGDIANIAEWFRYSKIWDGLK